jgi:hypothetical protein
MFLFFLLFHSRIRAQSFLQQFSTVPEATTRRTAVLADGGAPNSPLSSFAFIFFHLFFSHTDGVNQIPSKFTP